MKGSGHSGDTMQAYIDGNTVTVCIASKRLGVCHD